MTPSAHRSDPDLVVLHAGDPAAVTESTESYHAVWFQLHEDLLVTLGRPRW